MITEQDIKQAVKNIEKRNAEQLNKPIVRRILNSIITKGQKKWNISLGKWQTDYIIIKTIKLSKYEIARGYPTTKYIVDKWYKLSFVGGKSKTP